jgi:Ribonuclease G/E
MSVSQSTPSQCSTCRGSGEFPTESGTVDCPDCGGEGHLPSKSVLTEWRLRDLELAAATGPIEARDVRWLLAEIRNARFAA